jgi:clan AA aspartic protease (TIGR02281 family)
MRGSGLLVAGAIALWAFAQLPAADSARAEIYKWEDGAGNLHFSQDLSGVPSEYREQAAAEARKPKNRDPLQRYSTPARVPPTSHGSMRTGRPGERMQIPFQRHGTLMKVDARVNDRVMAPFYIDSGASGISIPYAVAQQLGIAIGPDTPRVQARTANGLVSEPLVTLQSVQLGPARVTEVQAVVSGSMNIGLLGGSFFNNFVYQVDSAAGVITLVRNEKVQSGRTAEQWRQAFRDLREPLRRVEEYLARGDLLDGGRVRELEAHRDLLRAKLEQLDLEARRANVPQGWRE